MNENTWYWLLLELSANLIEAIAIIVLLYQFLETRYKYAWPYVASTSGIFAIITLYNLVEIPIAGRIFISIVLAIALGFLLYKGSIVSRCLLPLLMMALNLVAEVLTVGIVQMASNDVVDFVGSSQSRLLGIIISKTLLVVLVYSAGRFSKKEQESIPLVYSLNLMIVPIISVVCMLTLAQYIIHPVEHALSPLWFVFSAMGLMFLNLFVFFLFRAFINYNQKLSQYNLMVQQADMLGKHLREKNSLQEETHRIWHDMKNHFTVIQWMVKSRNYDKLEQYLLTLNETVAGSMQPVQSGNPILDALLIPKLTEAKKNGIEMTINASVPSGISIEDIDLSVVFSNALDNAMEACKKLTEGEARFITVDTYIRNDHLVIIIKNSFDGVLNMVGSELRTTKSNKQMHGIGMGNMKRTVEKYDGHIITNAEDTVFTLSVAMHCTLLNAKAV